MRVVLFVLLIWGGFGFAYGERPSFAPMTLTIKTANQSVTFTGEFARTPEELAYGLMFTPHIEDDYAMLFDLGTPRRAGFWMKDVSIPLDMIFVAADGRIDSILTHVPPMNRQIRSSKGIVRWVIETAAGTVEKHGISVGDRITSDRIGGNKLP